MIYTKTINVDVAHQYVNDVIRLHEGDVNGAALRINVYENGAALSLASYSVKYDAVIAGYLAENDANAIVSENSITVPVTSNMTAKNGTLKIDVKIISGNDVAYLQTFEAFVQRRVINEEVVIDVSGTTIGAKFAALEGRFPVVTADIADDAVTTDKLASGAVTSGIISTGAVTTGKINTGAITTGKIADNAVTEGKIADNSVATAKIADFAVTSGKLDTGAVTAAKIADNAVTTSKIDDLNVTTSKIADGAVTYAKLDTGAVNTINIENNAVTADEIAPGAVTYAKLASDVSEHLMSLSPTISNDNTASLQQGQLFKSGTAYYVKSSSAAQVDTQSRLAMYPELNNLANIVGDANDLLEAALNYQEA